MFYTNYFSSGSLLSLEGARFVARLSRSMSLISKIALSTLCRWIERMTYSSRKRPRKIREGMRVQPRSWLMMFELMSVAVSFVDKSCCKEVSSFMSLVYSKMLMPLQTVLRADLLHVDTVHEVRKPVGLQEMHGRSRTGTAHAVEHKFSVTRSIFELFGNPTHDYLWWYVDSPGDMAPGKLKRFSYVNNYSIHTTNVN